MDVHVITDANKAAYAAELDQLFRIRHRIYVEEKKWREPSDDGRETDQFDTKHAIYLVGIRNGQIIAGSRFIPTTELHLLREVFPHLCTRNGVVRDSAVFEWRAASSFRNIARPVDCWSKRSAAPP
jgi:acyl-homoserine lactone synthase